MLLSQENLVWTVPAPSWSRRKAVALQEQLKAGELAPEKLHEQMAELPLMTEYRFTFASVTIQEEGRRDALLKSVREDFEKKYNISAPSYTYWFMSKWVRKEEPDIAYPEGEQLDREEALAIWVKIRDIADWATFVGCLVKLEERQRKMIMNGDGEPPWKVVSVPGDWLEYQKFIKAFPRALLESAIEICNDLNPGMWETRLDEDSKNFGGVSVRG